MVTKLKICKNRTKGLLSLEASIALTIFIFLMLFMYSYLVVFEARNQIGHVLLSTSDSLSLDAFATDTLGDDESLKSIIYEIYTSHTESNGLYTENSKWYEEDDIQEVVKTRFLAYLSGGDETEAERILKQLNIVGGFEGLDFSNCKVSGNEIMLEVQYSVDYEFQAFGLGRLTFSQSCCSKLWK